MFPHLIELDILTEKVGKRGTYVPGRYVLGELGETLFKMFTYYPYVDDTNFF